MNHRSIALAFLSATLFVCDACGDLPGRPAPNSIPVDPDNITDFSLLYTENCSGCHGADAKGGAALALADPVYLAIVDDNAMHKVVTNGIPGTSMAAFAKSAGGMLTEHQVDIIVRGVRQRYSKPDALAGATPPPYTASTPGDANRGAVVYDTFCSSCHGANGKGGPKASSIVDGSFLALLTDQELRTLVIVGRPDLGAPDWRNNVPSKAMTPQEISDVVAWLSAKRPQFAGRPYPSVSKAAGVLP